MNNSIIKSWNNKHIRFREDGFGCLTDMAIATGKQVDDWMRLKSADEYLEILSSCTGIPVHDLFTTKGRNFPNEERGTWAHRRVCIRFAQWCSAEFSVQVDTWIEELLLVGAVSISEPTKSQNINIFQLEREVLFLLGLFKFKQSRLGLVDQEQFDFEEIAKELNSIHPMLVEISTDAFAYLFSMYAISNDLDADTFVPIGSIELAAKPDLRWYQERAADSICIKAAHQFQAQIEREARHQGGRTQLAAAPTQKQLA